MNRNDINWRGYIPAITTPFDRGGAFNPTSLETMVEWYVKNGMHGLVLAGTSGEWFSMNGDELALLFTVGARAVAGRITVIGGCNAFTARDAIEKARSAERAKLDGILLTPPPYIVPGRSEILRFYKDVAAATNIPICVYNWPRGCVVDMDIDLLEELSEIDRVVAIKNSTGSLALFLEGAYRLRDKVRYFNMPSTALGADLVMQGVSDGLMGAGGILGSDHPDFWNRAWAGDKAGAIEFGERDRVLMKDWVNKDFAGKFGSLQAILKTALRMRGLPAGYVRAPLLELEPHEVEIVRSTLLSLGIEIDTAYSP
ncbi:dihydrodipicolinate synthase family protein [Mesorhizobium sp. M0659]|uniref:dihydrodipicolinate synthase family protein n=1 Tax=Mesorhizobium sp. M0659 TaxID=2956980 RepID=UPI00333C507E